MNKKGGVFFGFIFAFFILLLGFWMIPFVKDMATDSRTDLDCTNSSISNGEKVTCLGVDGVIPAFIISLVLIGGGAVVLKLVGA